MTEMPNPTEFDQYLNSLLGIHRASPKPFFTGRVIARLNSGADSSAHPIWMRWKWVISFSMILILINIFLLMFRAQSEQHILTEYDHATPSWVVDYTLNPSSSIYDSSNK
jgi:hypothetical protein